MTSVRHTHKISDLVAHTRIARQAHVINAMGSRAFTDHSDLMLADDLFSYYNFDRAKLSQRELASLRS